MTITKLISCRILRKIPVYANELFFIMNVYSMNDTDDWQGVGTPVGSVVAGDHQFIQR